ncbi:DUF1640 domain-containing protein [Candidatus Bipolaricaulota bacterium]|nr:DUF1640 domain-containing protein [Candidatus Bipolaricaulota bacterium]
MKLATRIYEAFKDDEEKARVLAEVVEELESRLIPLGELVTKGDLEITKLTLQKEIEQVRGEIEQVRLTLQKEIEQVRREMEQIRASIIKWVAGLLVAQTGVIVAIITLVR